MSEIRDARREDALAAMRTGVADGSLHIRQMTAAECAEHEAARQRWPRTRADAAAPRRFRSGEATAR